MPAGGMWQAKSASTRRARCTAPSRSPTYADGKAYIGRCDEDENVGLGVKWSADRTQAWEMEGGFTEVRSISPEEAAFIAKSIGLPVP